MLEKSLTLRIEEAETAILEFKGEIIFDNSNQLKEEVKKRLTRKKELKYLIIDLSQVPYVDSSGVGVILSLFKFMRNRKGSLAVAEANQKIKRVFEVTKLEEIIPLYDNLEVALEKA